MGAGGCVIGFKFHVKKMIIERIKELEEVKEAMKKSKNPDLEVHVDFNPSYPEEARNSLITITFSVKDSVPSPSDTDAVSSSGAPAPSSSPPASVDVVAPVSDVAHIELYAEPFYEIFKIIVSYLESYASFNPNLDVPDEYIDYGVRVELKGFIGMYPGTWSYHDTESNPLPDNHFLLNCCGYYGVYELDEDIKEFYDDVTPLEASKDALELFLKLFPTWETMKYYFDEEMLIEYDEIEV